MGEADAVPGKLVRLLLVEHAAVGKPDVALVPSDAPASRQLYSLYNYKYIYHYLSLSGVNTLSRKPFPAVWGYTECLCCSAVVGRDKRNSGGKQSALPL